MIRLEPFYLACLCFLGLSGVVVAQLRAKPPQKKIPSNEENQTKTATDFYAKLKGDWTGSYSLWLRPGTPAQISDIKANFQSAAKGNYFLMTYIPGRMETKRMKVCFCSEGMEKLQQPAGGDSFHMVPEPMQCKGELEDGGNKLIVKGSYSAGEGPAWGWRTEFSQQSPNLLLMEAYNIMPDGVEALAVKAELKRVTKEK